jgi:hypothetical protein
VDRQSWIHPALRTPSLLAGAKVDILHAGSTTKDFPKSLPLRSYGTRFLLLQDPSLWKSFGNQGQVS